MSQLLFILTYNALKYTIRGDIKFKAKLLEYDDNDETTLLRIKVIDTGCGMNEEQTQRLFTLFQNTKFKKQVNSHGVGLGLTKCKRITDALNGHIKCKSTLGRGTTFIVEIPVKAQLRREFLDSQNDEILETMHNFD